MSRIRFAVWKTVAARPIAPAAIPNASVAIFGERKQVVCLEGSRLCRVQKKAGVVATSGRPASIDALLDWQFTGPHIWSGNVDHVLLSLGTSYATVCHGVYLVEEKRAWRISYEHDILNRTDPAIW